MTDLETEQRLSTELKGAGWSLDPPDGARQLILARVGRRRRTVRASLVGGVAAVLVVAAAVSFWPTKTAQPTATRPAQNSPSGTSTTPPNDPQLVSVLPPEAVIARLIEDSWFVRRTGQNPELTRGEAVARAEATGIAPQEYTPGHSWLLRATLVKPGIRPCLTGCNITVWLVQFPWGNNLISHPQGLPPALLVGNLVLIDATSGDMLLDDRVPRRPCIELTTDSCPQRMPDGANGPR